MKRSLLIAAVIMSFSVITSCSDGVTIDSEIEIPEEYLDTIVSDDEAVGPDSTEAPEGEELPVTEEVTETTETEETPAVEETPAPTIPSDSEIKDEFLTACDVYGGFNGLYSGVETDYEDKKIINGVEYYKSKIGWADGLDDKESVMNYLGTLFSDSILEEIVYMDHYEGGRCHYLEDTDEGLYTLFNIAARGGNIECYGDETYEVIKQSDTKLILRVTVKFYPSDYFFDEEKYEGIADEDLDFRLESFDYPYEYIDGEWKFTEFDLYY